jgi:Rrf2 family cysteine metabolism transcriptional repressor
MRISAKAEYACLAIIELARSRVDGRALRAREIAEAHHLPERYLVQILLHLKSAGLIRSNRGATGGYTLLRDAEAITLAEVISIIDGPGDPPRKATSPTARDLGEIFQRAHSAERLVLAGVKIAEFVGQPVVSDYVL